MTSTFSKVEVFFYALIFVMRKLKYNVDRKRNTKNQSMIARVAANICGYFFALFIKKQVASC
ncbi:hypothetical protein ME793_18260 [Lactobacillus delbrueckii]|nr:hypothetical protein ME786_10810 [Lactobacillus delbrueckii]GHN26845.1 hypothetical protein ME787_15600 [Lactobacillus delbrueckii]GHN28819.1 hypothetical protein ME788_16310 [Lactobacillus delbrueckii]GHN38596.1 hypothetical protein ME793_18260 [Lactobacillus delbrueckii]